MSTFLFKLTHFFALIFITISTSFAGTFPRGCEVVGFGYSDNFLILNETFDLFTELGATDEQLDFSYCYASGLSGFATRELNDERKRNQELQKELMNMTKEIQGILNKESGITSWIRTFKK